MLDRIASPKNLKSLNTAELATLAEEIRRTIIETTAETGGHIGASLGAVELTLAMHRVYDAPNDKLVWDIGHQAYAHKLITGRQNRFSSLRQLGGISGFLKRQESEYDVWEGGHGATSLSGALGMAVARDLKREPHRVIAVIGDGALTAGMAWEALNQIGHLKSPMVVVVNDNSMSIAPNVGSFSRYLTELRSAPGYARLKQEVETLLESVPVLGGSLRRSIERLKDLVHFAVLSQNVFEALGFEYFGPIDGHDLNALIHVLTNARSIQAPVVVHVITQKGRGYLPAENRPEQFHGPGPFDIASGNPRVHADTPSYSQVAADTLVWLGQRHPELVAITAAMGDGTKLDRFAQVFPDRFYDVGMAEQHAATFAAGLAASGMRPVFAVYSTFLQRAYDQVVHDICHQNLPVLLAVDRAGLVGADGATHQGIYDISFLRAVPHMEIAMGKNEAELRSLLVGAIERPGPVAVRYPRGSGQGIPLDDHIEDIPWGRAEWIHQGEDVTLVGLGPIVYAALSAAVMLEQRGFSVGVVNARFVEPLDTQTLLEVSQHTKAILTLEEHTLSGGFGSRVLEWAAEAGITVPIRIGGIPHEFVDQGPPAHFLERFRLTPEGICRRVEEWLARGSEEA